MHGDSFDIDDLREIASYLDSFDDFWEGYIVALAFTAHKYESANAEPEPLYSNPGGDISDVVDIEELLGHIDINEVMRMMHDCIDFICTCHRWIGSDGDWERAGSDFHLTRNGHGAGFWDGDWEHGKQLTDQSETWGALELSVYGDSYYIGG